MVLRDRIAALVRWQGWPGLMNWRRYAPAAGSIVTHIVLGAAAASFLAASGGERMPPRSPSPMLEITLVADTPATGRRPAPSVTPRSAPTTREDALPDAPPPVAKKEKQKLAANPAPGSALAEDDDGVYLGDTDFALSGVPLGLRGLLEEDPCAERAGKLRLDCDTWSEKIAKGDLLAAPTLAQLKRMYPGFVETCRWRVGCNEGEWVSLAGTRSVGRPPPGSPRDTGFGTPMAGGAAGLGGLHDSVGRLGVNPDHMDPGFGD
jgi:hypothetical protein